LFPALSVHRPGYGPDDRGSIPGRGNNGMFFSSPPRPDHRPSYPIATGAVTLGIKLPGRETDHSSPSRAEIKNAWS